MNLKHFKQRLLDKERELVSEINHFETAARDAREAEVEDPIDVATSAESKASSFQEGSLRWQMLTQVREALRRIEDGSFGQCMECGREIEPARLEAIPWTPYCREDQDKLDQAAPLQGGLTL